MVTLNRNLVKSQNLSAGDMERIEGLHETLQVLFAEMNELNPKTDQFALAKYVPLIEEIENEMQRSWKFPVTKTMHSWWFRAPHCYCPKLDNMDMMGSELRYYRSDCPVHGNALDQQRERERFAAAIPGLPRFWIEDLLGFWAGVLGVVANPVILSQMDGLITIIPAVTFMVSIILVGHSCDVEDPEI